MPAKATVDHVSLHDQQDTLRVYTGGRLLIIKPGGLLVVQSWVGTCYTDYEYTIHPNGKIYKVAEEVENEPSVS